MKTNINMNALLEYFEDVGLDIIDINNFNIFNDRITYLVLDDYNWNIDLKHYSKTFLEKVIFDILEDESEYD